MLSHPRLATVAAIVESAADNLRKNPDHHLYIVIPFISERAKKDILSLISNKQLQNQIHLVTKEPHTVHE